MELSKIYNPLMKLILQSPLHRIMSSNTMLITYKGRKTGKKHAIPVNYLQEDNAITIFSYRHRTRWKNLRQSTNVTLKIKGKDHEATAQATENTETVTQGLLAYLQKRPNYAKYFHVTLTPQGQPNPEEVEKAAQNRTIIKAKITQ